MGTSFANLQIRMKDTEDLQEALKSFNPSNSAGTQYLFGRLGEDTVIVLGDLFNWENIHSNARELSRIIEHPILSVGYFDDEILEISLFSKGDILSRFSTGFYDYEMDAAAMDFSLLIREFGLSVSEDDLEQIFINDDLEEMISELEEILSSALWIKFDWMMEDEDEELKNRFEHLIVASK